MRNQPGHHRDEVPQPHSTVNRGSPGIERHLLTELRSDGTTDDRGTSITGGWRHVVTRAHPATPPPPPTPTNRSLREHSGPPAPAPASPRVFPATFAPTTAATY